MAPMTSHTMSTTDPMRITASVVSAEVRCEVTKPAVPGGPTSHRRLVAEEGLSDDWRLVLVDDLVAGDWQIILVDGPTPDKRPRPAAVGGGGGIGGDAVAATVQPAPHQQRQH